MQTAEQQIALWPHPQMLLAAHAQRAPRDADRFAYLGDEERLVRVLLHNPAKAAHDNRVLPLRQSILPALPSGETVGDSLDQRLFETASGLGMSDDFGRVFRQARNLRVQLLKPCHRRWCGSDDQRLL